MLKAGVSAGTLMAQLLDWRTIVGLGIYGAAAFSYIIALRQIPLSVALPCTALSYIAVALVSYFMFNEPLGAQRIAGLAVIGIGVMVLATS